MKRVIQQADEKFHENYLLDSVVALGISWSNFRGIRIGRCKAVITNMTVVKGIFLEENRKNVWVELLLILLCV